MKYREGYIDALRGLAMLMVVICHIEGFSIFIEEFHITLLRRICEGVMLPLFFFISGSIFKTQTCESIIEKCCQLLIPAILIGIIYSVKINKDVISFFLNIYKYGYWFTITLCEMIVLLFVLTKIITRENSLIVVLVLSSFLLYIAKIPFNNIPVLVKIGDMLCLHQFFIYFQYFSIGYVLSKQKSFLSKILNSEICILSSIFIFVAVVFVKYSYTDEQLATSIILRVYRLLQDPILGYAGIMILYRAFFSNKKIVSNTYYGKTLIFIGQHTFEIYLLHYFFLPKLPQLGVYLVNYPSFILELLIVVVLSYAVILVSMICGKIIGINKILGFIFLGAKPQILNKINSK